MLGTLWTSRERPPLFSRRFLVVTAKRVLRTPALLSALGRAARLKSRGASVGDFTVIEKSTRIIGNPSNLTIGTQSFVGRDVEIALQGKVLIGNNVVINSGSTILTASHSLSDPMWPQIKSDIIIEDYAWISTKAIILPGVRIGRGAVVGAGAVVRQDIPPYRIAIGNPSIILERTRCGELNYSPVCQTAIFEAWLGKVTSIKQR